jgi:hypothetical protein
MKRNTKKQPSAGTLSYKEWAQSLQRYHEAEAEKWRKAEEQHQAEKRKVYWEGHHQTYTDVQRELHAMLERHGDLKLYEHVGRVLAAVRDKYLERDLNEGRSEKGTEEHESDQ